MRYTSLVICVAAALTCGTMASQAAELDRPVKVFIVAGQSNAKGYNNFAESTHEFPAQLRHQPDILFWPAQEPGQEQTSSWTELKVAENGSFGPEMGFANELAKAMPNERIAIIKCAVGGTGIARSADYTDYIPALEGFKDGGRNWHPPTDGKESGKLYKWLIKSVDEALTALDAEWELAGCLWMQGEHEAGISRKMAENYDRLLSGFIASVRSDLKMPSLPFLLGEINSHTWAFGEVARKKQAAVCRDDANAVLVKTTDLSRKGSGGASHFDADSMPLLGFRFARAFISLREEGRCREPSQPQRLLGT